MHASATVNYHVSSPKEQAFHIDAGGEEGKLISPELVATRVGVGDARNGAGVEFNRDSVAFVRSESAVSGFGDQDRWQETYDQELHQLLARETGAREAIIFDHTVRTDDPDATRKPARNVHSDYSAAGAHQRLRDLLGEERAEEWEAGHFAFINIWRPIGNPINSAPLGFVRPASVAEADWLTIKLIYPDRTGSIMGLVANDAHEWIYLSKMTPDEVALFNIYDNRGKAPVAHSALDMIEDPHITVPRKSIESRALVRY
ncbi:MAG: CmcJ/NvfI family oxidoreductase [Pseudomonadota bacterium]